jgi:diguanylate cyclase (GGDEF)-like protein/putative nucleotidyltransferase with HDIG domain
MHPHLLLNVSVRYWQDFQDTLAKAINANIYIFDAKGTPFSRFSLPIKLCEDINKGKELRNEKCTNFYKLTCASLKDKDTLICPYGIKLCAYRLGSNTQKIGCLVVVPATRTTLIDREEEIAFVTKANNVYRTINEVFNAILEKNVLGLRRLELNSIYEISRLMTSIVELDKVLELITNSLVIIYEADLCFIGLREGDKIRVAHGKGVRGSNLLIGKEWPLTHPLIEQVSSKIEPSTLSVNELKGLPGFADVEVAPGTQIMVYPLWTALGIVGLLGTTASASLDDNGNKNLQIYINFAAVALANATLIRRLEKEAATDFLTDLFNKRVLGDVLAAELQRAARYGYHLSVIFLDIDDFKAYNDTFGHLAGDVVLQEKAFQTDLIVSSVAVFAAWVVGGLMEIEKKTQRELIKLADYDHLTGLYNHRYLQERLTLSLKEAAAKNFPVALVLFDIDQFRYYNSVYGYQKGDEILAAIGRLLIEEVKEPNYAARYGADEFMVVFPGMNKEEALVEADRLGKEIGARATLCLEAAGNGSKPFTVSTGTATYPADGDAAVPLIRAAEDDLFRTKYSGGKTYLYRSVLSEICTLKIQEAFPTLQSLVALINARDRYTFGHSERVLSYALALAEKLGLPEAEKEVLRYGAYLHDLGKIEIEPAILNKPTRLSTEEWAIMKNHTVWGSEMLKSIPAFREILPLLRSHHENYDGSGYPDQLKGKEIPLLARILRLADSFDAMTTDRPYRKALSFAVACQEIEKHAGSLYDPELVPLFLEVVKEAAAKSPRLGAAESSRERVAERELKKASG